jgi:hypothetical protein
MMCVMGKCVAETARPTIRGPWAVPFLFDDTHGAFASKFSS